MQRAFLSMLSFGLIASIALAQPAETTDQPSVSPTYSGRGAPYGATGAREYRLDPRQTQRLIERWKASQETAEREKLEAELRGQLKREFAARLAVHEREIKQLEEKVRQLRERLALRREKQDEIVDHRLQQILREAQGLGWGSEGVHSNAIYQYWQAADATQAAADALFTSPTDRVPLNEGQPVEDFFGEAPSAGSDLAPK
ncbi:MAG TPA: hypothetical protein VHK01_15645 [Lacipirellulaceae bacterium]|nr:hypothetical protein [Lacipirellulaceae bacterium]